MIKKRDNFLFIIPVLISAIIILTTVLLMYNVKLFETSYNKELQHTLDTEINEIEWVITSLLKGNKYEELEEYAKILSEKSLYLVVVSEPKNVAISTYNNEFNTNVATSQKYFSIGNDVYSIQLFKIKDNVFTSFNSAEKNILLILIIGLVGVLILTMYILLKVRLPFNKLQQSAAKIASGDLDTEIFVPPHGVLWELARAINIMAKQLKRQIKNMKKLEQFRTEFIANVSHEIKTPLTSILSAVEILESTDESMPPSKKCLKIISEQSKRLNRLIQDILSLADLEKKQILKNRDFSEISLNETIISAVNLCMSLAENANIELLIDNAENDTRFFANSYLLEQAIINLVTNAIKYSQTDKIIVRSKLEDKKIKISVKDFGIGIDKIHSSRIFERFYRVDKARSNEKGGTGLGLAIVKNIAKLHNGNVELISSLGSGSEFIIVIPYI